MLSKANVGTFYAMHNEPAFLFLNSFLNYFLKIDGIRRFVMYMSYSNTFCCFKYFTQPGLSCKSV